YLRDATDWQWQADELGRAPQDACCIHTGSLALAIGPGGPLIEDLLARRRPSSTISLDPNVRPQVVEPTTYRSAMARWAALAHVIRLSDEDMQVVAPGLAFEQACREWHELGVRLVVLTRGAEGAIASLDGATVAVPAITVKVVDTVGAGDAFT